MIGEDNGADSVKICLYFVFDKVYARLPLDHLLNPHKFDYALYLFLYLFVRFREKIISVADSVEIIYHSMSVNLRFLLIYGSSDRYFFHKEEDLHRKITRLSGKLISFFYFFQNVF